MILRPPKPRAGAPALRRIARRVLTRVFPGQFTPPAPVGTHLCELAGVKVKLDFSTPAHALMYREGGFEPELTALIASLARPGDVFADIGGNVGWHTFALLLRRPDVLRSYVFEPSHSTFEMLMEGVRVNGLQDRVEARNVALSSAPGVAMFKTFSQFGSTHASLFELADWSFVEEQVTLATLDDAASDFVAPPALVKCDVEGGERDVLLGAPRLLGGAFGVPPILLLEANYESAGMAGYFPYDLIDIAAAQAPYVPFVLRDWRLVSLPRRTALRHGDTLVLAIPAEHRERIASPVASR